MATVHFTLESTILGTTIYITHGNSACIKKKEIPSTIEVGQPGTGKVQANNDGSCATTDSHIHIYFWADSEYSEKLADLKLFEKALTSTWGPDVSDVAQGYNLNTSPDGTNEYTFILDKVTGDGD